MMSAPSLLKVDRDRDSRNDEKRGMETDRQNGEETEEEINAETFRTGNLNLALLGLTSARGYRGL